MIQHMFNDNVMNMCVSYVYSNKSMCLTKNIIYNCILICNTYKLMDCYIKVASSGDRETFIYYRASNNNKFLFHH